MKYLKRDSLVCVISLFVYLNEARAQGVSLPDPKDLIVSSKNVDPIAGTLILDFPEFLLGDKGDSLPINFFRTYRSPAYLWTNNIDPFGEGWSHNYVMGAHYYEGPEGSNAHQMHVIISRELYKFSASLVNGIWSYYATDKSGATAKSEVISGVTMTVFTSPEGYQYYFSQGQSVSSDYDEGFGPYGVLTAMIDKIVAPNGEQLKFSYVTTADYGSIRLESIKHSRGYGVIFKYLSPATTGTRTPSRQTIKQIVLADKLCSTFPYGCDETGFRKFDYGYGLHSAGDGKYKLSSVKNPSSEMYRFLYEYGGLSSYSRGKEYLTSIFTPLDSSAPSYVVSYGDSTWGVQQHRVVTSLTAGEVTTNFSYPHPGANTSGCPSPPETVQTNADGSLTRFRFVTILDGEPDVYTWCAARGVYKATNQNGKVTEFRYGNNYQTSDDFYSRNQLTRTISPEQNYESTTLDERGNIVLRVATPKPGSGLSPVSQSYSFPACTTINFRHCNKPDYEIDGKNGRTDYFWSDDHGGIVSITKPADADGVRPKVSYEYVAFTGVDGATFYLTSSQTERISATQSVVTTFEYDPDSAFRLIGTAVTSGGQTSRTCYGYDPMGRRISETKPVANLASCQ